MEESHNLEQGQEKLLDDIQFQKMLLENEKLKFEIEALKSKSTKLAFIEKYIPVITAFIAVVGFWFGIYQFFRQEKLASEKYITEQKIAAGRAAAEQKKYLDEQSFAAERYAAEQKRYFDEQKIASEKYTTEQRKDAERYAAEQREKLSSFQYELRRAFESKELELRKPLWEKQLAIYFEASAAAATISRTQDPVIRRKAEETFWQLYQGPLAIIETKEVSGAMAKFGDCLDGTEKCSDNVLGARSLELASAIQESLSKSWNVTVGDLPKDKYDYRKRP
jgi:hypothetical protein